MFIRKTIITAALSVAALAIPATAAFAGTTPSWSPTGDPGQCQSHQDPQWNNNNDPQWNNGNCDPTPPPKTVTCPWGSPQQWWNDGKCDPKPDNCYQDNRDQQWSSWDQCTKPPVRDCDDNWGKYDRDGGTWDQQQWNDNCRPPVPVYCHNVVTPQIENLVYVTNTTGEVVTVTLDGNFYWVQTKDNGVVKYYGPTTTTITLLPGQSISVAWHLGTGWHSWHWTGREDCTQPCNNRHGYLLVG